MGSISWLIDRAVIVSGIAPANEAASQGVVERQLWVRQANWQDIAGESPVL